jgi:hypothetical protein
MSTVFGAGEKGIAHSARCSSRKSCQVVLGLIGFDYIMKWEEDVSPILGELRKEE